MATAKGYTYCLSVRSRDKVGNVSGWPTERCTAFPLDDRSLAASYGWTRGVGSGYYTGTFTNTRTKGATLTRTSVQARSIAVVVTRCPSCGSIAVYWNGTLVRQISLYASTTMHKQITTITTFATARAGTVTIKTLNAGTVRIDGLAISRT